MNVRIKTAHGYLSFQPNGRLEYRAAAGPWENLEIEGLTLEAGPGTPAPGAPGPVDPPGPVPAMSAAYVAAVKAACVAAGIDLSGGCGAFQITKRVAWGLRAQGVGLVAKPSGNNCDGYSVDYLCFANGDGADILGDAGNANTPQWAAKPGEFTNQGRWRAPVAP